MKLIHKYEDVLTCNTNYHGETFTVPVWCRYIATDADGGVHAYQEEPCIGYTAWCADGKHRFLLGIVELDGLDWRDSLEEI